MTAFLLVLGILAGCYALIMVLFAMVGYFTGRSLAGRRVKLVPWWLKPTEIADYFEKVGKRPPRSVIEPDPDNPRRWAWRR